MKFYDLHCDTISVIYELRKQGKQAELSKNSLHLDLEKLQRGGYGLQTFALFVDKGEAEDCCLEAKSMVQLFKEELKKNQDVISQVFTFGILKKMREGESCLRCFLWKKALFLRKARRI